MERLRASIRLNERLSALVSHALVGSMMACLAIGVVRFGQRLFPGWNGGYLPWISFFVAIEALYATRATRHLSLLGFEWLSRRGSELIVLLVALRGFLYVVQGPAQLWSDVSTWPKGFAHSFFSPELLVIAIFSLAIWAFSSLFAEDLATMEGDEALLSREIPRGIAEDRVHARARMADRIIYLGAAMIFMASMARVEFRLVWGERDPIRGSVANLVAYFVLSLALLSQTHFAILRASWSGERIPQSRSLALRWAAYSGLFLLLLACLALALPTRYTLGFLAVLRSLLNGLVTIVLWGWGLLMSLFALLLSSIGFGKQIAGDEEAPPFPTLTPTAPESPGAPFPWWEALKSLLFWGAFLGVIGFVLHQYVLQNRALAARLRGLPLLVWLKAAWRWLRGWLAGAHRAVSAAVSAGLRRMRPESKVETPAHAWKYTSLRRLPPRQRVFLFYLALVRRGEERGYARRASQTPFEYEQRLRQAIPGAEEELAALTGAFVEARYSHHPVTPEQAGQVRRWWERLKKRWKRPAD